MLGKRTLVRLRLSRPLVHAITILLGFWAAYFLRQQTNLFPYIQRDIPPLNFEETLLYAVIATVIFLACAHVRNLYELWKPIHGYTKKYMEARGFWMVCITFIAYFGQGTFFLWGVSRFVILVGGVLSFLFILLVDMIINRYNFILEKRSPYKVLILHNDETYLAKILDVLKSRPIYEAHGILFTEISPAVIKKYDIILLLGTTEKELLQSIFDTVRLAGKRFFHIAEGHFIEDVVYHTESFGGVLSAFEYKASSLDGWSIIIKRGFDIISSLLFLILFWWIYILVALFIWLLDGRPILYVSHRVGRGGKEFTLYKFRTMVRNAEQLKQKLHSERSGPLFKVDNDPRILPRGRFLRRYSLDELPQIWNILIGTMSVVGPRPHIPTEIANYKSWQKRLLSIKPGLTGYAQIFGRHMLSFDEEANLDLYYIQNRSLALDLIVILSTIKVLGQGK